MKKWTKYLISTIVFETLYIITELLLSKNINWKMFIITAIIYTIVYTGIDLICNKLTTKK